MFPPESLRPPLKSIYADNKDSHLGPSPRQDVGLITYPNPPGRPRHETYVLFLMLYSCSVSREAAAARKSNQIL